ncbi:histidine phosphatase family protein [Streptomyces antioxidans]|uniref:Histidine phosphatase family protein n=1 Tax=Streptomyces antioxidans TaxID=1507734 RepID=A0A1V4D8F0_9ACTN|nr:histidine phosphatase family protein [Streptomyces antioxidans]
MRSTTQVFATRHGQTEWNAKALLQGHQESNLTDLGREQSRLLGVRLNEEPLMAIYSSASGRALSTARLIAEPRGLTVSELPGLEEMDLGQWQGLSFADVAERWPEAHDRFWSAPLEFEATAGGESFHDLYRRAAKCLARISQVHAGECVLLVTHSLVLKALWLVVTGRPLEDFWMTDEFAPGGLTLLEHRQEWEVSILDDRGHLSASAAPIATNTGSMAPELSSRRSNPA